MYSRVVYCFEKTSLNNIYNNNCTKGLSVHCKIIAYYKYVKKFNNNIITMKYCKSKKD